MGCFDLVKKLEEKFLNPVISLTFFCSFLQVWKIYLSIYHLNFNIGEFLNVDVKCYFDFELVKTQTKTKKIPHYLQKNIICQIIQIIGLLKYLFVNMLDKLDTNNNK